MLTMHKEVLTTIIEENESEISSTTPNQTETNDYDEETEINSTTNDDEMSVNTMSMHSKTFTIDSDAPSYMCFKEIVMSSSSVFSNPLYFFPNLEDPGIQDALSFEPPTFVDDECQKYKDMCKDLEIYPISRVCKSLYTKQLNLKYYVPIEKQMKAICRTLENNQFIEEVNLQDNWLSVESCSYLMNLLDVNRTLKILKLKECRIGPEGMATLNETLGASFIEELDLSFNSLGDDGLKKGMYSLGENQKLKKLNLSHNELTEESAIYLREILTSAGSLEELNLAWNSINSPKGLKILCNGLKNAESLRGLSLAWNGISTEETVLPLLQYIRKDLILEFLDLSNNLLKGPPLTLIMKGVSESNCLKHVKIGNNIFSPEQAFSCAQFLEKPRKRPLKLLDMENMVVQRRFLNLLERIREQGKDVIHGTVLTNYEIHGPYIPKILFERCRYLGMKPKKKRRRADFGQLVLSLPNRPITSAEFESILIAKKLKSLLDHDLISAVQNQYMNKKTQKIDCSQLVNDYMILYPDTELVPPKKRKLRKKKASGSRKKKKTKNRETVRLQTEKVPSLMRTPVTPTIAENILDGDPQPLQGLEIASNQLTAPTLQDSTAEGTNSIIPIQKSGSRIEDGSSILKRKSQGSHTDNREIEKLVDDHHEITVEKDQQNPLTASGVFIFEDSGEDKK